MPAPKFKKLTILTLVGFSAIVFFCWLGWQHFFGGGLNFSFFEKENIGEYVLKDGTMGEQIKTGEILKELKGYYLENEAENGHFAMIGIEGREPFPRKVAAVPGDDISFEGANLKVNGNIVKNSAEEPLLFPDTVREELSGAVPQDSYLVVSDQVSPSSFDSRSFGFVKKSQLLSRLKK